MRVTTLFKRLLRLEGVRVVAVALVGPGQERGVVDLPRPQARRRQRDRVQLSEPASGRCALLRPCIEIADHERTHGSRPELHDDDASGSSLQ